MLAFMVNGARKNKSKISASFLQPMNILNLIIAHRPNRNLQRIKEVSSACIYNSLPFNMAKISIGIFCLEFLNKAMSESEPNQELFGFIEAFYKELDAVQEGYSHFHLYFLTKLSRFLGFYPHGKYGVSSAYFNLYEGCFSGLIPEHDNYMDKDLSKILSNLINSNMKDLPALSINKTKKQQFLQKMLDYYKIHIQNFSDIKSMKIYKEIFE